MICLVFVGVVFAEKFPADLFESLKSGEQLGGHFERADKASKSEHGFKIDARTKEILLKEKYEHANVFLDKAREFFLENPNRQFERQCFGNFKAGESIDFVIDIAASPELDKVDKLIADSPIAYYLSLWHTTPSRAYFEAIRAFIDAVTYDMKPEFTHSIIYDQGKKYFIRGESIELGAQSKGEFIDARRNLKTMWPVPTKSTPSETFLRSVLKNNLGRMTKLALWNRDNGLATVLNDHRRSKPVYTIVITDGASGAKINYLCDELSRTSVIDLGNRRFANAIDWQDMRRLVSVVTLNAPQQLVGMVDTCRLMACKACGC